MINAILYHQMSKPFYELDENVTFRGFIDLGDEIGRTPIMDIEADILKDV